MVEYDCWDKTGEKKVEERDRERNRERQTQCWGPIPFYGLPEIGFFGAICSHVYSQLFRALQEMRELVDCGVLEPLLVRCLKLDT